MKRVVCLLGLVLALFLDGSVFAQEAEVAAAPLPAVLISAKRLFIGNAGDQSNADCLRAYNIFYAGVQKLGRFELVSGPGEAELALELHYEVDLGQSLGSNDAKRSVRQFRVVLRDPKTQVVVWSLTESTNYAVLQKNRDKNLDETVSALVHDFDQLATSQPPNNKSRIRHHP